MPFLNEYTLLGELGDGKGGFANVYKVRHNELGYLRAIRVLKEPVADEHCKTYQKFLRECKVLLRLGNGNHRNIVHIYQPRLLNGHALVEMDFVDGMDLNDYLKSNEYYLPIDEVLRMVDEISSALSYCHEDIYKFCIDPDADKLEPDPYDGSKWLIDDSAQQNLINKYKVIHNDIHSGNIMRREDGSFVLLDFGLAIEGDEVVKSSSRHDNGAPEYMSPEKWESETILSEQSDIYSFGIVMFEYLAGRVPFVCKGNSFNERTKLYETIKSKAPLPSISEIRAAFFNKKFPDQVYKKDYPDWLEEAIVKCLQIDPSKRFRNGKELRNFIISHKKDDAPSNGKVISLLKEKETLEEKVKTLVEIGDTLKQKNSQLAARIHELENSSLVSKPESDGMSDAVQEELNKVKSELQNKECELEILKSEIKKLGNNSNKKATIGLSILSCILAIGMIVGAFSYSQMVKENEVLKRSENSSSNLVEEVMRLENLIKQKDQEISAKADKINSLERAKNLDISDNENSQILQDKLNAANTTISKLRQELTVANSNISSLKKERDALRDAINP